MSLTKAEIIDLILRMPGEFEAEEIIFKIHLLDKLKSAEEEARFEETFSNEDTREEIERWLSE